MIRGLRTIKAIKIVLVHLIIFFAILLALLKNIQNNCNEELLHMYIVENTVIQKELHASSLLADRIVSSVQKGDVESAGQARFNIDTFNLLQSDIIKTQSEIFKKINSCKRFDSASLVFEVFQSVSTSLGFVALLWD